MIATAWKQTQQKNSEKIIAPIKVAQQRLAVAAEMMDNQPGELVNILQTVRASSLNCYVFEALPDDSLETKASLASQQFQFSDPCTFRLIVKNVTGLSDPGVRTQGEAIVEQLVNSYQKLDGELEGALTGGTPEAARAQIAYTQNLLGELETYVKDVLAV